MSKDNVYRIDVDVLFSEIEFPVDCFVPDVLKIEFGTLYNLPVL